MIHPAAIVEEGARVAPDVEVGPWSYIGADVEIGPGTRVGPHVVIKGPTRIGRRNQIFQFSSLGDDPQDKKFAGEPTSLEIGDDNVVREYCTLNRGTGQGGGVTRIGNGNWIMAYVHVAHDCTVGDDVVMANGTTLAGHVQVGGGVTFGAFTVVHQFCAIGASSFSAMGTVIFKDVPPFVMVAGNSARAHGLNVEGLRRRDVSAEDLRRLRHAYKTVYKQGLTVDAALQRLEPEAAECERVRAFCEFVRHSGRGIVR